MIVTRIREAVRQAPPATERRQNTGQPWGISDLIPPPGAAGIGSSGANFSEGRALAVITVLSCVSLLADSLSTLDVDIFEKRDDNTLVAVKTKPDVIEQPWSEITSQDWFAQQMYSATLRGNAFGLVVQRDRFLYPTQVMPVHPDSVRVKRDKVSGRRVFTIDNKPIPAADIVHVPALTIPGQLVGLNPIEFARSGIQLALNTEAFGNQFFENGTQMSGVLEVDHDLGEEETLALAQAWMAAHQGVGKAHLPAVLTSGATWKQLSVNPDDAQFLDTRKFQRSEIAMLFRIPPHMIGDVDKTTSWGTGIEQQEQGFITHSLRPWLGRFEQALTMLLPTGLIARFNLDARLRGDTLQRYQGYTLARNGGWLNIDEIRAKEGDRPLLNGLGQDYWAPMNFMPLDQFAHVDPKAQPPVPEGSNP